MKKHIIVFGAFLLTAALVACNSGVADVSAPVASVNTSAPTATDTTGIETEPSVTEPTQVQTDSWIFPDSDQRYLRSADLKDLSLEELVLADNEILARRGCIFTDPEIAAYFEAQSWYTPTVPQEQFSAAVLSECERSNARLIELYLMRLNGPEFWQGHPFAHCYHPDRPYMIATSDTVPLIEGDYLGMTPDMVYIAWNEILARHGYVSDDQVLTEYFIHHDWYLPDSPVGKEDSITLSAVEEENIRILKAYQKTVEDQGLDMAFTNIVSCDCFSVTTPAYWAEYSLAEVDAGRIRFREIAAYEAEMGGHVFTLLLYNGPEEYDQMPAWKLQGTLTDSSGKQWHLVALYPTDVQFDIENADMYMRMDRAIDSILATITAADGCTFTPAQ